jgi:hypothetical protein
MSMLTQPMPPFSAKYHTKSHLHTCQVALLSYPKPQNPIPKTPLEVKMIKHIVYNQVQAAVAPWDAERG